MDELLQELLMVPGVPGYEDRVRALIEERLPPGLDRRTDSLGNLVVTLGEGGPASMFVAHMDEIGFVVSEVRDDGFLKLKPLGGIDPRTVFGRLLRIVTDDGEVEGVVSVKPPHLMQNRDKEMGEVPQLTEFLVDLGTRSADETAERGVKVLDFAVIAKQPTTLHGNLYCARALDDRAGCYILLEAVKRLHGEDLKGKLHFAFSVQEEVGLRGAMLLARKHELAFAFAVDSSSTADWPEVSRDLSPGKLGDGPCLRVLDNASIVPPAFRREIAAIAETSEIPLQTVFSGGGTDARPFQTEGPQVMSIGFPLRYTHSAVELVHRDDVAHTIDLVCAIARHYAGD